MSPRQISFGAAVLSYVWNIMWVAFYVTVGLIKHALWLTTRTKKLLLTNHFVSWMKTSDRQSHLHFVLVSAASQRPRSATLRIRCDCGGLDEHVELSFERVFSKKRGTGCTHEYKWASTRRALFFLDVEIYKYLLNLLGDESNSNHLHLIKFLSLKNECESLNCFIT